ncbi:response regulator [Bacillus kwashiorkori]|uniref:response regulator n=1 Tax=Bacillus kwashiorkori TaxID=1522318 RepID=UPI000781B316|nr:response regulator transcription factor [Bacillus kwashiorkori]
MIKVMVVDDHRLIRKGLVMLLEAIPDIEVVGEAENGDEAVLCADREEVDVILMDISMPNGLDGFTAAETIQKNNKQIKIVFLSMHDEEIYIQRAIQANACGYIFKNSKSSDLEDAIKTVYKGNRYFNVGLADEQLESLIENTKKDQSILTTREKEIVRLSVLGFTNREIAEKLFISPKTVENHKTNIMKKLGLKNKSELIQYGLTNKYLDLTFSQTN